MTNTSPTSGSFAINRRFNHGTDKVFAAFSNPATKAKWFTGPKGGDHWNAQSRLKPAARKFSSSSTPPA